MRPTLLAPPIVGEPARALPSGLAIGDERPAVIAFLRHVGCPFAEATARALRALAAAHPGVRWIAVTHAPEADTRAWSEAFGGLAGVTLLVDEARSSYAAWGARETGALHFAGGRALAVLAKLGLRGVRNRRAVGTRFQSAATFAVDGEGRIAWRHLPAHAGDLPDLDEAVRVLRAIASRAARR